MGNKQNKSEFCKLFLNKPKYRIIMIPPESDKENICNNSICVFKSINGIYYLIYSTSNKSIITYNIITNQRINEIKNADDSPLFRFEHCMDKINHRDLLLTIFYSYNSSESIKIWNLNNFECILEIQNIHEAPYPLASCFFNLSNEII